MRRSELHRKLLLLIAVIGAAGVVIGSAPRAFAEDTAATDEVEDSGDFTAGPTADQGNEDSEKVVGLTIGAPTYGGTGCPQGSVSATLSPDSKQLSVLYDAYISRAGGATGAKQTRTDCSVTIPFTVPAGYRAQVVKMDYRGFAAVPKGAGVVFNAGFRYDGWKGSKPNKKHYKRGARLRGPMTDNFTFSSRIKGPPWSPCGGTFAINADSALVAETKASGPGMNPAAPATTEEVVASIDSLDAVAMPVRMNLRWKKCDPNAPNGPGNGNGPGWGNGGGPGGPGGNGNGPGWGNGGGPGGPGNGPGGGHHH